MYGYQNGASELHSALVTGGDLPGINLHPLPPKPWQEGGETSLRCFFKESTKLGKRTHLSYLALCPSCLRIS